MKTAEKIPQITPANLYIVFFLSEEKWIRFKPIEKPEEKTSAKIDASIRLNVIFEEIPESFVKTAVVRWPK